MSHTVCDKTQLLDVACNVGSLLSSEQPDIETATLTTTTTTSGCKTRDELGDFCLGKIMPTTVISRAILREVWVSGADGYQIFTACSSCQLVSV